MPILSGNFKTSVSQEAQLPFIATRPIAQVVGCLSPMATPMLPHEANEQLVESRHGDVIWTSVIES
jgi:hypothetical protein